jgi:hypothetical protein
MSAINISRRDARGLSGAALGSVTLTSGTASAAWDPLNPPPNRPGVTSMLRRR